jgi:hypothetical protein
MVSSDLNVVMEQMEKSVPGSTKKDKEVRMIPFLNLEMKRKTGNYSAFVLSLLEAKWTIGEFLWRLKKKFKVAKPMDVKDEEFVRIEEEVQRRRREDAERIWQSMLM